MALLPAAAFAEPLFLLRWPVFRIGSFILSFLLFFAASSRSWRRIFSRARGAELQTLLSRKRSCQGGATALWLASVPRKTRISSPKTSRDSGPVHAMKQQQPFSFKCGNFRLTLHLHQVGWRIFAWKLSIMLDTKKTERACRALSILFSPSLKRGRLKPRK
jgi:hypothetical protein